MNNMRKRVRTLFLVLNSFYLYNKYISYINLKCKKYYIIFGKRFQSESIMLY